MPSPKFAMTGCVGTLLLGLIFMAANIYFSGTRHSSLANMFFVFAVISEMAFVVFAFLWVYSTSWHSEPESPAKPPPGAAGNKMPPGPGGLKLPPGTVTQKLPPGAIANKQP